MRLQIEPTEHFSLIEAQTPEGPVMIQARAWHGVTPKGTQCVVFVPLIATTEEDPELDAELRALKVHRGIVPL